MTLFNKSSITGHVCCSLYLISLNHTETFNTIYLNSISSSSRSLELQILHSMFFSYLNPLNYFKKLVNNTNYRRKERSIDMMKFQTFSDTAHYFQKRQLSGRVPIQQAQGIGLIPSTKNYSKNFKAKPTTTYLTGAKSLLPVMVQMCFLPQGPCVGIWPQLCET